MCNIIHKPADVELSIDMLRNCHENNPDGWGIMYWDEVEKKVLALKDITKFDEFLAAYETVKHKELGLHFRWTTHGLSTKEMAHPYPVKVRMTKDNQSIITDDRVMMMHNGILSGAEWRDPIKSDSCLFVEKVIEPLTTKFGSKVLTEPVLLEMLMSKIGHGNKLMFVTPGGKFIKINEKAGQVIDRVWHSNPSARNARTRYVAPIAQPYTGYGIYNGSRANDLDHYPQPAEGVRDAFGRTLGEDVKVTPIRSAPPAVDDNATSLDKGQRRSIIPPPGASADEKALLGGKQWATETRNGCKGHLIDEARNGCFGSATVLEQYAAQLEGAYKLTEEDWTEIEDARELGLSAKVYKSKFDKVDICKAYLIGQARSRTHSTFESLIRMWTDYKLCGADQFVEADWVEIEKAFASANNHKHKYMKDSYKGTRRKYAKMRIDETNCIVTCAEEQPAEEGTPEDLFHDLNTLPPINYGQLTPEEMVEYEDFDSETIATWYTDQLITAGPAITMEDLKHLNRQDVINLVLTSPALVAEFMFRNHSDMFYEDIPFEEIGEGDEAPVEVSELTNLDPEPVQAVS